MALTKVYTRQTTDATYATNLGAPLTNAQIDANFINLNTNKLDIGWTGNTSFNTAGTISTGTWQGTTIATGYGGTGLTTFNTNGAVYATSTAALTTGTLPISAGGTATTTVPTNGQLLIGNGTGYSVANLTQTANQVLVTNTSGNITLSTPQDIATTSSVQFGAMGIGVAVGTAGTIRALKDIVSYYSDERLKENIKPIESALDKVDVLRGVTYTPNAIAEELGFVKEQQVGVLAQDVQKVLPEAVKPAPFDTMLFEGSEISRSGENYMTVQYEKLVPLLIEAIKELNIEIKKLKESR